MDVVLLIVAFCVILVGAEMFTNGIEWFGHKLELAEGVVGSVLAAVGTALPETMIPLIAILFGGGEAGTAVGIGAILGAPFMLATLAMFVTGVTVVAVASGRPAGEAMPVNTTVLAHDMRYFAVAYALAVLAAFLPADLAWPRWLLAVGLLVFYGLYVREHFAAEYSGGDPDLAPLRLRRLDRGAPAHLVHPRLRIVTFQVLLALGFIVLGAFVFVGAIEDLSRSIGVQETILALVIAPIATELPEKLNSVIWVRQGKDTLAMGNITGAMVFQSMIPTSVALLFASSHWAVAGAGLAFASAAIAFASAAAIFIPMALGGRLIGRQLLLGGAFYVVYLGLVGARVAELI